MKPSLVEEITQGYFLCVCRFLLVAGHKTLTLGSMEGRTLFTTPKKRRWLTGLSRDLYMGQDDSKPESLGRACVWWHQDIFYLPTSEIVCNQATTLLHGHQ